MSLAHIDLSPPRPRRLGHLSHVQARVVARTWRDRARDAEAIADTFDRAATALLSQADMSALTTVQRAVNGWRRLAATSDRIASAFSSDEGSRPDDMFVLGPPDPAASELERASEDLLHGVYVTSVIALHLHARDLDVLEEDLARKLQVAVQPLLDLQPTLRMLAQRLLALAPEYVRASVSATMLGTFERLYVAIDEHMPPWVGMTADLSAKGVRSAAGTRALALQTTQDIIVPTLEDMGFAATWAWRRASHR
jgi:hypothetical protein